MRARCQAGFPWRLRRAVSVTSMENRSQVHTREHRTGLVTAESPSLPLRSQPEAACTRPTGGGNLWLFPRQHGAWSILLASYAIGTFALDGKVHGAPWLVLGAVLAGFVAQHAILVALQGRAFAIHRTAAAAWAALHTAIAASLAAILLTSYDLRPLLPLLGVATVLALLSLAVHYRHRDRTTWGELLGVVGLTTVIPIASVARTGGFGVDHALLWSLGTLYFCGSVFHVRHILRNWRKRGSRIVARPRAGWASSVYHAAAFTTVVALSALGLAPRWASLAFLPSTVKAFRAMRPGPDRPPVVRGVGLWELAHAALFSALIILAYQLTT